jgi:type VI protein secretion system component Hcp
MASNIFMSLKGIYDESDDAKNGTTAKRNFDPTASGKSLESVVTKQADARSAHLFRYCCEGYFIGEVDIYVFGLTPSPPYMTYSMRYVHIARYEPSCEGDLAMETIGLRYGQMTVTWNAAGAGTKKQGNPLTGKSEATWSWVMEAPIKLPKLPSF